MGNNNKNLNSEGVKKATVGLIALTKGREWAPFEEQIAECREKYERFEILPEKEGQYGK